MTHTIRDKQKPFNRIRRLRGQIDAIERAHESEVGCTEIMCQPTTAPGAINGIVAGVVEDHIHMPMIDENRKPTHAETVAAGEPIEVLRTCVRRPQSLPRRLLSRHIRSAVMGEQRRVFELPDKNSDAGRKRQASCAGHNGALVVPTLAHQGLAHCQYSRR
jgi:DNA-binding FrmR family transcriptional regulator